LSRAGYWSKSSPTRRCRRAKPFRKQQLKEALILARPRLWPSPPFEAGARSLVDDKAAQRILRSKRGQSAWLTTPAIIVEAIRSGRLTVDEADALREAMDAKASFRMKGFNSFRELLGQ
jgi:hypothetical protein